MLGAADAAVAVLAGDQPSLPVDRVAVGIAGGWRNTLTAPSVSS